jgi:maleate isomerase
LADYFERAGLNIISLNYMGIADDRDVARLTQRAIIDAACAAIDADVEAMFISCTATRAAQILPEIEQATGLPVFSSNHSSFWQTMRILKLA